MSSKEESRLQKDNFHFHRSRVGTQLMLSKSRQAQRRKAVFFLPLPCFPTLFTRRITDSNYSQLRAAPQKSGRDAFCFPAVKESHSRAKWGILSCSTHPGTGIKFFQEMLRTWKPREESSCHNQSKELLSTYSVKISTKKRRPLIFYSLKPILGPLCHLSCCTPHFF